MTQAALSIRQLSLHNLRRRPFRTAGLITIVTVFAIALFGGSILILSLKNGLNNMELRLGADLMVVPDGYEAELEGVLLKGEPCYFYFNKSVEEQVAQIEGVSQVTSQLFLTSISGDCCSLPVQLIAIDPADDFVIQPWVTKNFGTLEDGQFIAGSDITIDNNGTLKFYNHPLPVAAQLDETSTGMDSSVFMTRNTMEELIAASRELGRNFLLDREPEGSISAVLIRIEAGYPAEEVAKSIHSVLPEVGVIVTKSMLSGIANSLEVLVGYIRTLSGAIWALAVLVLAVVFSVTMNERKKEFAIFRTLGATRRKIVGIALYESVYIGFTGGIIGAAAASAVIFPFSTYISDRLQLPYLEPRAGLIFAVLILTVALSAVIGPLASICSAVRISKAETYLTMREGE
jgi:putative ABC transport system permease protein